MIQGQSLEDLLPISLCIETPDITGELTVTFSPHKALHDLDDFKFQIPPLSLKQKMLIKHVIEGHISPNLEINAKYIYLSQIYEQAHVSAQVKPNCDYIVGI
jgi:hypothetical protein